MILHASLWQCLHCGKVEPWGSDAHVHEEEEEKQEEEEEKQEEEEEKQEEATEEEGATL
jgi:hypothetical protein